MENDTYQIEREQFLKDVIGLPEEEVRAGVKEAGGLFRVRSRDGQRYMGTCDLRMDRLNVHVVDGVVTEANYG